MEDETLRKIMGFDVVLIGQVAQFNGYVFVALLAQEYGLTNGGLKGSQTYSTYDNLIQVEVRIAED